MVIGSHVDVSNSILQNQSLLDVYDTRWYVTGLIGYRSIWIEFNARTPDTKCALARRKNCPRIIIGRRFLGTVRRWRWRNLSSVEADRHGIIKPHTTATCKSPCLHRSTHNCWSCCILAQSLPQFLQVPLILWQGGHNIQTHFSNGCLPYYDLKYIFMQFNGFEFRIPHSTKREISD